MWGTRLVLVLELHVDVKIHIVTNPEKHHVSRIALPANLALSQPLGNAVRCTRGGRDEGEVPVPYKCKTEM
jgi:hypothetical protein